MRAGVLAIAGYLAGCSFSPSHVMSGDDSGGSDARVAPDACRSITDQFDACMYGGAADLTVGDNGTYNTDTGMLVVGDGEPIKLDDQHVSTPAGTIDLVPVRDFKLADSKTLVVSGTLALAIFATGTIDIAGTLDVGADGSAMGPGGRASCDQGATTGAASSSGGGGGGGGAFAGAGGNGGTGKSGATAGGGGGSVLALPNGLLGGCSGAQGGSGGQSGGLGGGGGGAILLASAISITTETRGGVNAGGGGGDPGHDQQAAGGGGGAGGFILLQAPTITNLGFLAANGGGGGEGANSNTPGNAGENAHVTTMPAMGGSGTNNGGNGGQGGADQTSGGTDGAGTSDGGGGGGGGVGYIAVQGALANTGVITPPITIWP
jgi:hypothetical protein